MLNEVACSLAAFPLRLHLSFSRKFTILPSKKKEKNRVLRLKKELRASPVPRLFSFSSLAQFSRLSRMTLGRGLVPLDLHGPQWQEFEFKDVFSIFTYATVRATQWYFWLVD